MSLTPLERKIAWAALMVAAGALATEIGRAHV